ncbi:MAG: GC-type dockerin domain-anchored protein [Phycisphaerales bacterium JB054]
MNRRSKFFSGTLIGLVVGCHGAATAQTSLCQETAKLVPESGAYYDYFGHSVSVSGSLALVGVPQDDDSGQDSGSAYVFSVPAGERLAKIVAPDGQAGDQFGYSVAISGNTAVIGAPYDDDTAAGAGSAYLFDLSDPGAPEVIAKIQASDAELGDQFGWSVAIADGVALVGSFLDWDNGPWSGSAYLFDARTGTQLAKLLPDDGQRDDNFGFAVGISGAVAIVGAPYDSDNGVDSGSAYLFDVATGSQIDKLLPSNSAADNRFGQAVAVSGSRAIVGAFRNSDVDDRAGCAYLFDSFTGVEQSIIYASDGARVDFYGSSVAISGTLAVIGAVFADHQGTNAGTAYLLDVSEPASPFELAKFIASDGAPHDNLAWSVAISGATSIAGAYKDDDFVTDSGSAYLFDNLACWGCVADWNHDGSVNTQDFLAYLRSWAAGDGLADLTRDGVIDTRDFILYLSRWASGC